MKGRYGYHPHRASQAVAKEYYNHHHHHHPTAEECHHKSYPYYHNYDAKPNTPIKVIYPDEYDFPLPQQQRDDYDSGSSTIQHTRASTCTTPSPQHPRQPPPPPPPPPPYSSPHGGGVVVNHPSRQQYSRYPYDTTRNLDHPHRDNNRKSRLSIEIPHTPPSSHAPIHPIQSMRPATQTALPVGGGGGGGRPQTPNHHQYNTTTTAIATTAIDNKRPIPHTNHPSAHHRGDPSSSSSSFAEYELCKSEARHQMLKEISQATTMRNSALEEEDRKFWDKQIATLNRSFQQL